MGSEAKRNGIVNNEGFKSRVDRYLHSGDTKHVMAGMAIITLVFGVPWFLMNRGVTNSEKGANVRRTSGTFMLRWHSYLVIPIDISPFLVPFGNEERWSL
ncbi:hypothetical protein OIU77_026621 [Salix suchowensis]|uniref:Uncharacterized protein n=1 Tax=Salix suchowensis TaxID=1278906 RepID=A0ABQ9BLW7_9ROSI|nr:hypothetical protein OIU77_026621 [Salix suchowensis]